MAPGDEAGPPREAAATSPEGARSLRVAVPGDARAAEFTADLQQLCRAGVAGLPVDGAVVHLFPGRVTAGVAAASAPSWRRVGELVDTLGEAPCVDAARMLRPIMVPDLELARHRWPAYAEALAPHDVAAIFSLPLQVGAVSFGVLDLYATTPVELGPSDLALAMAIAQVATSVLLTGLRGSNAPGDPYHPLAEHVADLVADLDTSLDRAVVHQAQGMVMVLLHVSLDEALLRMRARAFALDRTLAELAHGIVSGVVDPRRWGDGAP